MKFEWDEEKERKNIRKHGMDFEYASMVFCDPFKIDIFDEEHSQDEIRHKVIGAVGRNFVVVSVIYTMRDPAIRIISARKATKRERSLYYDRSKNS